MDLKREVAALKGELIELRRDFHRYPELGFKEYRTAEKVSSYLKECGLVVSRLAGTGVAGLLEGGKPGKTLLLRADMDALPINEQNDLPYRSVNEGVMHACGHDGHTAMLLVAAKILARYREQLYGRVKFVFQPNEEDAGAYKMIEEGIMENPAVDAAAGAHLWPGLPVGTVDLLSGPVMAASHYFYLTVQGKGGHAGYTEKTIDPIMVSSAIIQAVQSMQTRELPALEPVALVFTRVNAGANTTIVPETAELAGSIRFLYGDGSSVKESFARVIAHTCEAHRASYDLQFKVGNEVLSNAPGLVDLARRVAAEYTGDERSVTSGLRTMGGEDFAEFARLVPAVFYFIGSGNKEKRTDYSIHHPCFNIDEDALLTGTALHVRFAFEYLESTR